MARGVQTDMGGGFGREIDEEVEGAAAVWLDLQAEKKDLAEQLDAAAEVLLAKMQARGLRLYVCSDGTTLTVETDAKVKGKRPKRPKPDAVEEAANDARKALGKLTEGGTTVTLKAPGKPEVVIGRGRRKGKGEAN